MRIVGIGIDIVQINRIKKIFLIYKDKFANKILTKNEFIKFHISKNKVKFLAKHFSVKEAASKALGTGLRNGITFKNFEIFKNKLGKPKIFFFHQAMLVLKKIKGKKVHITLTDEKEYLCSFVLIEKI